MIRSLGDKAPKIDPTAWVNEFAYVVGDVEIGPESSVWPAAVIRGDSAYIKIGRGTQVQDGSVIHSNRGTSIGDHVNIGHAVVIHADKIGNHCLIGNNATVLEGVEIGDYCIVGANAMVKAETKIPSGSFVIGVPAVVRPITQAQRKQLQGESRGSADTIKKYKNNPEPL